MLLFLDSTTPIGQKIFFLEKVSIDGLNLSDSDKNNQLHFKDTLDKVLAYKQQGADLYDVAGFPHYYKKLLELKQLLEEG